MTDLIYIEFRVEKEEYNYAVTKYNLTENPYVQEKT